MTMPARVILGISSGLDPLPMGQIHSPAWAASRKKDSYFQAQFRRLAGRRGKKRALISVARSLLVVIYHILKKRTTFKDLGRDYFDKLNSRRLVPYLVKRIENLGYDVSIVPCEAVA